MIVDPGVTAETGFKYYDLGNSLECFIKSAVNKDKYNGNLVAKVWPAQAAFPDFLHPSTAQFWSTGLEELHKLTEFDAIWLDMNEVATMCPGECPVENPEQTDNQT